MTEERQPEIDWDNPQAVTEVGWTTPLYDRSQVAPDDLDAYDRVIARQTAYGYSRPPGQEAGPYFGVLLHNPPIADHISELGVIYRRLGETGGGYATADREWVDMVLAQELGCNRVLLSHMRDAVAVGVRPEAIKAVREGRDEDLNGRERQLAEYIRAVARGSVTRELYKGLEDLLGVKGAVEYTALVGHLLMTFRIMQAFSVAAPTDADIDATLEAIMGGTTYLPDARARIPATEPGRLVSDGA